MSDDPLRVQLARALDWHEAHVPFDKAIDAIPATKRGARPEGFEHSVWQLLEDMRIAQADILDFCATASYQETRSWPDDYWPKEQTPNDAAWTASVAAFKRDREAMKKLACETKDLLAPVPTGKPHQTYLRAILLLIDHNAYHLGQIVVVRRALGIWPVEN